MPEKNIDQVAENYHQLIEGLSAAIYTCDVNGHITFYNNAAANLWGRHPEIGKDLWCGSWKIYEPDGITPVALDTCPMAITLKEGKSVLGKEIIVERPDGIKRNILPHPQPLFDSNGNISGAVNMLVDITEQKQSEQTIRENNARMRMAIEATKLGTWEFFPKSGYLRWSEECKKIYAVTEDVNINYQFFSDHIYPQDKEFAQREIEHAMDPAGNGNYDIQYRIIRYSDKIVRWVRAQGKVFFDAHYQPERFIGTVLDITDNKNSEQILRENEERLRLAVDAAELGTFDLDLIMDTIVPSKRHQQIMGYKNMAEWSRKKFLEFLHPDDRRIERKAFQHALATGKLAYEARIIRKEKDKAIRWIKVNGKIMYNELNVAVRLIGTVIDITDQKNAMIELQESEKRFKIVADTTPVMIWMAGTNKKFDFVNKGWLNFTGRMLKQELGRKWTSNIHPEDVKRCIKIYTNAFEKHNEFYMEYRLKKHDGEYRWVTNNGIPRYANDGTFLGYIGGCIDITQKKSLDTQKDEFLGIVSHELKTPLTSLKAYVQLLKEILESAADAETLEMMEKMNNQVNKLNLLVKDISDVTRIENGKLQFREDWFNLHELILEVADHIQRTSIKHNIIIESIKNIFVFGDKERIGQVITNLVTNAIKYSPQANKVIISLHKKNKDIICSVQDFGIGIPHDIKEKIFERFFRMPDLKIHAYPGLGLGLYISSGIIERLGGKIWVNSVPGKGSTFYFSIPAERLNKNEVLAAVAGNNI